MPAEKRLKKSKALSEELKGKKNTKQVKAVLKRLDVNDVKEVESTLSTIRGLFPQIDEALTPAEILEGLGYVLDPDELGSCPTCLSCVSCQVCKSCQTCNFCLTCESCNTCQAEAGMDCPTEAVGGGIFSPDDVIKQQLIQFVRFFAQRIG